MTERTEGKIWCSSLPLSCTWAPAGFYHHYATVFTTQLETERKEERGEWEFIKLHSRKIIHHWRRLYCDSYHYSILHLFSTLPRFHFTTTLTVTSEWVIAFLIELEYFWRQITGCLTIRFSYAVCISNLGYWFCLHSSDVSMQTNSFQYKDKDH